MSLIANIRTRIQRNVQNNLVGTIRRSLSRWLALPGTGYDWKAEAGMPQANLTVAIGMQTIIDKLQQSSIVAYKDVKGSDLPVVDDVSTAGIRALIRAGGFTPKQFVNILAISAKLAGPAYVVATMEGNIVKALTPFLNSQVTINADGVSYDIKRHGDGKMMMGIEPDLVIPILYGLPDPDCPLTTISPLAVAYREICADNGCATFTAATMKNMPIISYLASPKTDQGISKFSPSQRKDVENKIQSMTMDRSGGVYASPEPIELHKLGMSPDEMKVGDTKRLLIMELLGALGVDPMVCSLPSENRTFNNYAEARKALVEDTVLPLWGVILEPICDWLIERRYFKEGVILGPNKAKYPELDEDKDKKAARARDDFKALLTTRGEARVAAGYVERPDDPRTWAEMMAEMQAAKISAARSFPVTERMKRAAEVLRGAEDANPQ